MYPPRPKLSAVLITKDAAHQIVPCLVSLKFADEIIVVDGESTDNTPELAARYGARVILHPWMGFGPQKRFAVEQASHDWVLCIDADERVTAELAAAMTQTLANSPAHQAYAMPRSNYFMGRYLRHGEGYPDWSLRLFNRNAAQWSSDAVHEKVETSSSIGRIRSKAGLLHHSADSLTDYLAKQNRYTTLQAQALYTRGKRAAVAQLLLSPMLRFIKFYFVRGGLLDGVPGLVHILIGCFNSFAKYAKLMALEREQS